MKTEDFRAIDSLSRSLWADAAYAARVSTETVTAVSLLDLNDERALERAMSALLERALRDGAGVNAEALNHPFFRLQPEERLLLAALHVGRWSYRRIARVLGMNEEKIPRLAWQARLHLATFAPARAATALGSPRAGVRCPEYSTDAPWTQRFMDEEIPSRERLFLQNHLMACASCRQSLATCRDLYYSVDAMIPQPSPGSDSELTLRELQRAWEETRKWMQPIRRTFIAHRPLSNTEDEVET